MNAFRLGLWGYRCGVDMTFYHQCIKVCCWALLLRSSQCGIQSWGTSWEEAIFLEEAIPSKGFKLPYLFYVLICFSNIAPKYIREGSNWFSVGRREEERKRGNLIWLIGCLFALQGRWVVNTDENVANIGRYFVKISCFGRARHDIKVGHIWYSLIFRFFFFFWNYRIFFGIFRFRPHLLG